MLQVVLLAPAESRADVERQLRTCRTLRVNGRNVARWVRHLAQVYNDHPELCVHINVSDARLEVISQLDAVPQQVIDACVHARSQEEAQELANAFDADREGYARTHHGRDEDPGVSVNPFSAWTSIAWSMECKR